MESQVSFKFDGEHNKAPVLAILRKKLEGFRYEMVNEPSCIKIYVASTQSKEETLNVCKGIQNFALYDSNRELTKS